MTDLTLSESIARAFALGAFWGTGVTALLVLARAPVPLWAFALLLGFLWFEGGVAWYVYRRERRARGLSTRLLRP